MARSGNRFLVPVLAALAGLGLGVVGWMLGRALAPFFMAMVLAYLLGPAVAFLSRRMRHILVLLGMANFFINPLTL